MSKAKAIWERRMVRLKQLLGEEYEALDQDLAPKKASEEAKEHRLSLFPWAEQIAWIWYARSLGASKHAGVGVFLEPVVYTPAKEPGVDGGYTAEVAVRLQVSWPVKDLRAHAELVAWLRDQLSVAFPEFARDQLVVAYPNDQPKPEGVPFLYSWKPSAAAGDSDVPTVVWMGLTASGTTPFDADVGPWIERVASDLRAHLPAFRSAVSFVRGAVSPRKRGISDEALLGWCGEFAVHDKHRRWTWLGGRNCSLDFKDGELACEVKAGCGGLPDEPFFTLAELGLAVSSGEAYRVVRVAIDGETFGDLRKTITDAMSDLGSVRKQTPAGSYVTEEVWPHRLARDVDVPLVVATKLASDRRFRKLLAGLAERASIEVLPGNPFVTEPYRPLVDCLKRDLIRSSVRINLRHWDR